VEWLVPLDIKEATVRMKGDVGRSGQQSFFDAAWRRLLEGTDELTVNTLEFCVSDLGLGMAAEVDERGRLHLVLPDEVLCRGAPAW
jgi:hypothetical protein